MHTQYGSPRPAWPRAMRRTGMSNYQIKLSIYRFFFYVSKAMNDRYKLLLKLGLFLILHFKHLFDALTFIQTYNKFNSCNLILADDSQKAKTETN